MNGGEPRWQEDPTRRHHLRYWDGAAWTDQVSDAEGNVSTDPVDAPTEAVAAAATTPPSQSRRGLIAAAAVVVLLLLAGGAFVLLSSGDDEPDVSTEPVEDRSDDETTTTEEPTTTTTEATTTTTLLDDPTDVVGTSIAEALGDLQDAGFEVTEVEVIDESVADGQVTGAVEQPDGSVVLTVARPPVTRFLEQVRAVTGSPDGPTFNVSGVTYTHGVEVLPCSTQTIGYDLGRDFRRFQATAGVLDDAPSDARVRIEIVRDGQILSTNDLGLGDTAAIDIDVTGALRLEITATKIAGSQCFGVGFGDARLLGVPSEVPPLAE